MSLTEKKWLEENEKYYRGKSGQSHTAFENATMFKKVLDLLNDSKSVAEFYNKTSNVKDYISIDDYDSFGIRLSYFQPARDLIKRLT